MKAKKRKARFRLKYILAQAHEDSETKCAKSNKHPLVKQNSLNTGPGFIRNTRKRNGWQEKELNFSDRFTEASKCTYYIY